MHLQTCIHYSESSVTYNNPTTYNSTRPSLKVSVETVTRQNDICYNLYIQQYIPCGTVMSLSDKKFLMRRNATRKPSKWFVASVDRYNNINLLLAEIYRCFLGNSEIHT